MFSLWRPARKVLTGKWRDWTTDAKHLSWPLPKPTLACYNPSLDARGKANNIENSYIPTLRSLCKHS